MANGYKQETDHASSSEYGKSSYAWVIFTVSFVAFIICWGAWRSFGVFLKPMAEEFGWSRAVTAGPTIVFFLMNGIAGIYVGKLVDKYGPRVVIPAFGIAMGAGFALMSQTGNLWHYYLSYGLLAGIGSAVAYIPFVSIVSHWFKKRRGMVLGMLIAGIGVGIMIIPPLAQVIVLNSGWRFAYIVLGISLCLVTIVAGILLKLPPGYKAETLNDMANNSAAIPKESRDNYILASSIIMRSREFWIICFAYFALTLSLEMVGAHIVAYATDQNIAATLAAILLTVIGTASIIGKVTTGIISDRVGRKVALVGAAMLLGMSLICLPFARTITPLFICAALFGLGYGAYSPMIPAIIGDLFGVASMGTIMGLVLFGAAVGSSIGPVLAGYIFDVSGDYDLAFWMAAALSLSAALVISRIKAPRSTRSPK